MNAEVLPILIIELSSATLNSKMGTKVRNREFDDLCLELFLRWLLDHRDDSGVNLM